MNKLSPIPIAVVLVTILLRDTTNLLANGFSPSVGQHLKVASLRSRTTWKLFLSRSPSPTTSPNRIETKTSSSTDAKLSSIFSSHIDNKLTTLQDRNVLLTYLEINGWILTTAGITILIDPILDGPLDFGIPKLYEGSKRVISMNSCKELLSDPSNFLSSVDCILITQGLDDHAHVRTLKQINNIDPLIPIVAPPSARQALEKSGFLMDKNIKLVRPGNHINVSPRFERRADDKTSASETGKISLYVTSGALVGPPWQARENGYILRPFISIEKSTEIVDEQSSITSKSDSSNSNPPSLYIEPHVEYNVQEIEREGPVDAVITPITGQGLPAFELVHGPNDALQLVQKLQAKYVIPMQNGDLDTKGSLSKLVNPIGTTDEFQRKLQNQAGEDVQILEVVPGENIRINPTKNNVK